MIGIVFVAHGSLGKAMLEAVELIAGKQEHVETIGLYHGDCPEELHTQIEAAIVRQDSGEGVLVLVDFYGGTPANQTMSLMGNLNFDCLAGMNMGMSIEALTNRSGYTLAELKENCRISASDTIRDLRSIYNEIMGN